MMMIMMENRTATAAAEQPREEGRGMKKLNKEN